MESRRQQMGHGEALKAGQKQKPATYPGSDSSFSSSFAAHAGTSTSTRRTQLSEFYPLKCCRHPESSMIFSCSRSRSRSCCSRFFLTTTLAFAIALHSNSHSNTVQAMRAQESILHLLDLSGSLHSASSSSSSEAADASLKMQHALAMQLEHRQARGQQSKKLVLDPDTPQPSKDAHPRPSLQVVLEPMANAAASAVSIAALVGSGVGSSSSSSSSSKSSNHSKHSGSSSSSSSSSISSLASIMSSSFSSSSSSNYQNHDNQGGHNHNEGQGQGSEVYVREEDPGVIKTWILVAGATAIIASTCLCCPKRMTAALGFDIAKYRRQLEAANQISRAQGAVSSGSRRRP